MLTKSNLKSLEEVIDSENQIIKEFAILLKSASEPQLKTEIQKIISSHNNHVKKITGLLENKWRIQSTEKGNK